MSDKGWIGVDLDGTLAEFHGDMSGSIGEPVDQMLKRVKDWISSGQEVRIFTARANDAGQVQKIREWLTKNGIGSLAVTNIKDVGMIELWDDRAIRVRRNSGYACQGCLGMKRLGFSECGIDAPMQLASF